MDNCVKAYWSRSSENKQLPEISFVEAAKVVPKETFKPPFQISHQMFECAVSSRPNSETIESWNCVELVNAMHITASVFINDHESGLHHDYEVWLEKLAPHEPISQYQHNRTGEDNADAHMKRQVMGREVVVAATNGKLDFGPWEQIFYGEFDGRRRKRVLVKIIGE
jgi:secondary thiamine-phosphate synthase enzyme